MINAPHDKEFVFHDGTKARNLFDLVSKLENMQDHSFHHFVNAHKNDFASWIEHVFLDKGLADELRKTTSRLETIEIIKDKISEAVVGVMPIGGSLVKAVKSEDKVEERHGVHHVTKHEVETKVHNETENQTQNPEEKIEETHLKGQSKDQPIITDITREVHHPTESEKSTKATGENRHLSETELKEGLHDDKENNMWMILYFALILLIITLLIYKLFL